MTYREIFGEIYREHKLGIRIYIVALIFISVFMASSGNYIMAAVTIGAASTTVAAIGGSFGAVFAPVVESQLASFNVPVVMAIMSIISIIVQYAPASFFAKIGMTYAKQYSFGIIDFWAVRVFFFIWCTVSILETCGTISNSIGTTLNQIDKVLGWVVNIVVIVTQIFSNLPNALSVNAAEVGRAFTAPMAASWGVMTLTGIICFLVLIYCTINYFFISMLCSYVEILLVPLNSFIPGFSIVVNIVKVLLIICMTLVAIFAPIIFVIADFIIFVLAIVLFKRAYRAVKYYNNIYTKPMFKRIKGYRKDMPLYAAKLPKKLAEQEGLLPDDVVMPVYLLQDLEGVGKRHEKCYFIVSNDGAYICKQNRGKKDNLRIGLESTAERRVFLKKSIRYFEVFIMTNGDEDMDKSFRKIKKNVHFVFSKEYTHRVEDLMSLTGFTDFASYKKCFKEASGKQTLEQKLQNRMDRLQDKYEALVGRIFSK